MRAQKKESSEEIRERYLGEIAPLLDAARKIESLTPAQKKHVHRRILRTVFRTRFLGFHVRLAPILAALAMLVVGGAAFATAERLGLIPKISPKDTGAPAYESKPQSHKRKAFRVRPAAQVGEAVVVEETVDEQLAVPAVIIPVTIPELPDPLVLPVVEASAPAWVSLPEKQNPSSQAVAKVQEAQAMSAPSAPVVKVQELQSRPNPSEVAAKSPRRVIQQIAFASPATRIPTQPEIPREQPAPAPVPIIASPSIQTSPEAPVVAAFPTNTSPVMYRPVPTDAVAYVPIRSTPTTPPVRSQIPVPNLPSAPSQISDPEAALEAPEAAKPLLTDQALFGQAMRKLRKDNDPAGALSTLQEHARVYPRSSFGSERSALEVEALLTLHRDREALGHLDALVLDALPRSGERFVVRGELRAAVRRWQEAAEDFDRALSRVSGSPSWHERALWGRGVARLRLGERESGLADLERYLDQYPEGRFAGEAAKFFHRK
jgi:hypothetical protein